MSVKRLHHIGVIVRDLESAVRQYEDLLGVTCTKREEVGPGEVAIAWLPVGDTNIELLQPLLPGSMTDRFLQEQGEGVHHLAFSVAGIEQVLSDMHRKGVESQDQRVRPGAAGLRIAFINKHDFGGVFVELVEEIDGQE